MTLDGACVAWVHSNEVAYSWAASMLQMQMHVLSTGREVRWLAMRYGSGGIADARNRAVAAFLTGDLPWMVWIDTDMGFEPDAVHRLLEACDATDRPVVGGLCFASYEGRSDDAGGFATFPVPTIYDWAKQPDGTTGFVARAGYERDVLVECNATGSAFIAVHRNVFERIREHDGPSWYTPIPNPNGAYFGEDMSFAIRLVEQGVRLHVHTGIKTTHLKPVWLSEAHYLMQHEFAAGAPVGHAAGS